eukprot:g1920.t1
MLKVYGAPLNNLYTQDWKSIASDALCGVAHYSNELTGNTFNRSPVKRENFKRRFDMHMEHISKAYGTMVAKYEYKVGEFHTEREAKEKVKRSLEDTEKASMKAFQSVKELTDYALKESGSIPLLPPNFKSVRESVLEHTDCLVHQVKQVMEQSDIDASDAEHEATELKAQKAALEATLKLRDEEIARLKAEMASLNTRFDAMSSMAAENIISRYQRMLNNNGKRARINDHQVD